MTCTKLVFISDTVDSGRLDCLPPSIGVQGKKNGASMDYHVSATNCEDFTRAKHPPLPLNLEEQSVSNDLIEIVTA